MSYYSLLLLLLIFGSIYLFRIIHKSFSIYHYKGWGSGYIARFTSRLLIYKKPYRELQVESRKLYYICLFLAFAVVVVLTLGSSIFIIFYLFIYFLNFQVVCASVNYFLGFYHFIHVGFIWANGRKRVFPFNSSWFHASLNWLKYHLRPNKMLLAPILHLL